MLAVYGAGAVGLVIGARLARAGRDVLFVTRRAEVARTVERDGVRVEDPSTGASWVARAPAVAGIEAAARHLGPEPVLFCMRGSDVGDAARALARLHPDATAVAFQNDVIYEAELAALLPRVVGGVVRQTSTRTGLASAVAIGNGRLVIGTWPEARGDDADVRNLTRALLAADYDVGVSARVTEDKWLKLCVNLTSTPNAMIRRQDHETPAFVEVKRRLLLEAKAALDAAGIAARSCDGRDRSLDEEIAWQRESLRRGASARRLPVYNQVWAALRHGGPLEADGYHRRILDLAAAHELPAPMNARVLDLLVRATRELRGPECVGAEEMLGELG